MKGKMRGKTSRILPDTCLASMGLKEAAWTRTSTWPRWAMGLGISTTLSCSGPPYSLTWMACMGDMLLLRDKSSRTGSWMLEMLLEDWTAGLSGELSGHTIASEDSA